MARTVTCPRHRRDRHPMRRGTEPAARSPRGTLSLCRDPTPATADDPHQGRNAVNVDRNDRTGCAPSRSGRTATTTASASRRNRHPQRSRASAHTRCSHTLLFRTPPCLLDRSRQTTPNLENGRGALADPPATHPRMQQENPITADRVARSIVERAADCCPGTGLGERGSRTPPEPPPSRCRDGDHAAKREQVSCGRRPPRARGQRCRGNPDLGRRAGWVPATRPLLTVY